MTTERRSGDRDVGANMLSSWGETGDASALIEALYRVDEDEPAWLEGLWRGLVPLVPGAGPVMAGSYAWAPGQNGFRPTHIACQDPRVALRAVETRDQAHQEHLALTSGSDRRVYTFSELYGARSGETPVGRLMGEFGMRDTLAVQTLSHGGPHDGVTLGVPSPNFIDLSPRALAVWERVGAHLAAAVRLRRGEPMEHPVEGVLTPDGRIAHAEGEATPLEVREALGRAVVAIERARRREARSDPTALLEAWRAIVERRWSLVDTVESDGRRFMLARVNRPARTHHRALTPREAQVAALMVQGVAQKAIGYELELSPSTVGFHVKNIARKLGAATTVELTRLLTAQPPASAPGR